LVEALRIDMRVATGAVDFAKEERTKRAEGRMAARAREARGKGMVGERRIREKREGLRKKGEEYVDHRCIEWTMQRWIRRAGWIAQLTDDDLIRKD